MKRLWFLLAAGVLLAACSNEIPEDERLPHRGRTILAYLVANNNLDADLKQNVVWMYESMAEMTDSCCLLVYYRPRVSDALVESPAILEFVSDGRGNINERPAAVSPDFDTVFREAVVRKTYEETADYNATDPAVMLQVFGDMQMASPAESYGLIFGSHATGWMPADATVTGRAFGSDGGYSINMPELRDVLAQSFGGASTLDFILFDACMMGAVEVAYELRDVADYCIASVMETPQDGFPYHAMFRYLCEPEVEFQSICNAFTTYYQNLWGTCAVLDCRRMEALADAVAAELQSHPEASVSLEALQQYGRRVSSAADYTNFSFDVEDFVRALNGGEVPEAFRQALDAAVVAKSCVEGKRSSLPEVDRDRFCGTGMYLPGAELQSASWEEYYRTSVSWYDAVRGNAGGTDIWE